LLGRDGFRVVTAASRVDALRALAREPFALVVADVQLRDGNGLDVVRSAHASVPPTPAIVMSGVASKERRRAAREAGAVEFFTKPFPATTLAARVRDLARPSC